MSISLRHYTRGHDLVSLTTAGGEKRYYHFDSQGTTQLLTTESGAVSDQFASDAWGVLAKRTGTSINRQWYIGNFGYYSDTSERMYVRKRYLNADLGQWASLDPLFRNYGYAMNDPATRVDPSGLKCFSVSAPDIPLYGGWLLLQLGFEVCVDVYGRKCPPCTATCLHMAVTANIRIDLAVFGDKVAAYFNYLFNNTKGGRTLYNEINLLKSQINAHILGVFSAVQNGNTMSLVAGFYDELCQDGCAEIRESEYYFRADIGICGLGVGIKCGVSNSLAQPDDRGPCVDAPCIVPTISITLAAGTQSCSEGNGGLPCPK